LLPKIISQSGFPKLRPENYSQKISSEIAPHIIAPHNCSRKLFTNLLPKIVPEICSPKLVPQGAPELQLLSTTWKIVPKVLPENIPGSSSKIAAKNCSPKFFVNGYRNLLFFKLSVSQSCSGKLSKVAPQSCSSKLLPKIISQNFYPKLLTQNYNLQTYIPKRLPIAKLFYKIIIKNC